MTVTPAKERTRRSFWFDPRFAIGVVLVLASIAGVLMVVASADSSATGYARLGTASDRYVGEDMIPAEGLVVTRTVAAGELVPTSAVGSAAGERLAPIVVAVNGGLPTAVASGATVDVWAAREGDGGTYEAPTVLVPSATVARVVEADGIIAGAQAVSVELLIPRSRTARILEAIANADALSLIPVSLPANLGRG